jgi:hypothetical protein
MIAAALGVLAALAPAPVVGLRFEQTTVVRIDGGAQGTGVTSRVYRSGSRLRLEPGDGEGAALILHLETGKAWRLLPESRTAVVVDLEAVRSQAQMDAAAAAEAMGAPEEESVRTRDLGTRRTVAGRVCQDYRVTGPGVTLDICLDRAAPVGVEAFADFLEWCGAATSLAPVLDAVRGLEGFPMETRYRVKALGRSWETISTLTKVEFGPQPASLFAVPSDFRLVDEADAPSGKR